ncbi:uncharacterized protein LOC120089886 [Benincasa hispida]|uniref:uncharacterized protein LOC120089886 n=1 Tax=Benincasa hispida TaxID=102211 RepID=UPI001902079A|nr:uncharacterized protein LOC120089886 [Benincasa hispida]
MVLWEITLGTAYFLGLKRTYRLALKLQRRVVSPKLPKIRQFLHRRTRAVFDIALKVHLNIQQRDLEVGRNLGNWILRLLDRYKPSAQIRKQDGGSMTNTTKQLSSSSVLKTPESSQTLKKPNSSRQLFTSSTNIWPKQFPTISMMMKSSKSATTMIQHRHFGILTPGAPWPRYVRGWHDGVMREDIRQWMLQN